MTLTHATDLAHCPKGYSYVVGIDEAGRGPLAGPVVAAACLILTNDLIDSIDDSKVVNESTREEVYKSLTTSDKIFWAVSIVEHDEIDKINILAATLAGMRRATISLLDKVKSHLPLIVEESIALIDGNKIPPEMPIQSKFIIKGDSLVRSIAAASIIAKVTRDRLMLGLHSRFPAYGFDKHKGYPTAHHRSILKEIGPCEYHRMTFRPVRDALVLLGTRTKAIEKNQQTPSPSLSPSRSPSLSPSLSPSPSLKKKGRTKTIKSQQKSQSEEEKKEEEEDSYSLVTLDSNSNHNENTQTKHNLRKRKPSSLPFLNSFDSTYKVEKAKAQQITTKRGRKEKVESSTPPSSSSSNNKPLPPPTTSSSTSSSSSSSFVSSSVSSSSCRTRSQRKKEN